MQRAHDVTPYLAVNPIMIAEKAPFADVYLAEMQSFPRGANDDQVDPTVDAVKALLAGGLNYNSWVK